MCLPGCGVAACYFPALYKDRLPLLWLEREILILLLLTFQ